VTGTALGNSIIINHRDRGRKPNKKILTA
jgi:hypothetical protein